MRRQWPQLEEALRIDNYCFHVSKWYQIISNSDIHLLETTSLPTYCTPDSIDYENYMMKISAQEKDSDYLAVGMILKGFYKHDLKTNERKSFPPGPSIMNVKV